MAVALTYHGWNPSRDGLVLRNVSGSWAIVRRTRPTKRLHEPVAFFFQVFMILPGAVAEAVAIGTPVVCIGIGGTGEILAASNRGTAINPYSEDVVGLLSKAVSDAASRSSSPTRRWDSSRVPTLVANWYNAATEEGGSYGDN